MQTPFGNVRFLRIVRVTPVFRIVADKTAVAAALETVERPVGQFVTRRRFAEVDLAVRRDIEIVGQIEARIVLEAGAVRLVRSVTLKTVRSGFTP